MIKVKDLFEDKEFVISLVALIGLIVLLGSGVDGEVKALLGVIIGRYSKKLK